MFFKNLWRTSKVFKVEKLQEFENEEHSELSVANTIWLDNVFRARNFLECINKLSKLSKVSRVSIVALNDQNLRHQKYLYTFPFDNRCILQFSTAAFSGKHLFSSEFFSRKTIWRFRGARKKSRCNSRMSFI